MGNDIIRVRASIWEALYVNGTLRRTIRDLTIYLPIATIRNFYLTKIGLKELSKRDYRFPQKFTEIPRKWLVSEDDE